MELRNLTDEELKALNQDLCLWVCSLLPVLIGHAVAGTPIDDAAVSRFIDFDVEVVAELCLRGLATKEDLDQTQEALRRFRAEAP